MEDMVYVCVCVRDSDGMYISQPNYQEGKVFIRRNNKARDKKIKYLN